MRSFSVPGGAKGRRAVVYRKFRGVDFSADPALIDRSRSPYAPNLISDSGGFPEKRPGWRTLQTFSGQINGIFHAEMGGETHRLVHAGDKLYRNLPGETVVLRENLADNRSFGFFAAGKFWILTGAEYLVYDGETVVPVSEIAYVPTTVISRLPSGGGVAFEPVNLLTGRRKNCFQGDGETKKYVLDQKKIQSVDKVRVNGSVVTGYSVHLGDGKVTFTTAPAAPSVPGQDNVEITFTKNTEGYAGTIESCRFAGLFGAGGQGECVFFSGNPSKPNVDWHSQTHEPDFRTDPSYVPDTSFAYVGADGNAIMGYRRMGEFQAIIKAQNNQDATLFLRRCTVDDKGRFAFPLAQSAAGVGAISPFAIGNLIDECLFLSPSGIFGVSTSPITAERKIQNRSFFVDAMLLKEENLQKAVAVEWNGYFLLAVNSRCYILDGRQPRVYQPQAGGEYVYECYFWENVPAYVLAEHNGDLFFGTKNGRLCRFNTDMLEKYRYHDDGVAISAAWATKSDDDGDFSRYKTVSPRHCSVLLKPYVRSSARIYAQTEATPPRLVAEFKLDMLDFADMDFSRITFQTSSLPQGYPLRMKVPKYMALQLTVKNDAKDEGFGIYGIIKQFTVDGLLQ
jgi:hypothetical protein